MEKHLPIHGLEDNIVMMSIPSKVRIIFFYFKTYKKATIIKTVLVLA